MYRHVNVNSTAANTGSQVIADINSKSGMVAERRLVSGAEPSRSMEQIPSETRVSPKDQMCRGNFLGKTFLIFAILCISVANALAQDIIILKNGDEILGIVQEVGIDDIKYKKFEYPNGPNYTLKQSEIFQIRYENGAKDTFVKQTSTTIQYNREVKNCVPKNAFGLDLGIGAISDKEMFPESEKPFTLALGFRYLHHFNPYFGVDFVKLNNKISFKKMNNMSVYDSLHGSFLGNFNVKYFCYNSQLMTGVRGNTPLFANCISVYGALRFGIGYAYETLEYEQGLWFVDTSKEDIDGFGFCCEAEIGLNITRFLFVGYSYNYQAGTRKISEYFYDMTFPIKMHYHSFRIGFNFGK